MPKSDPKSLTVLRTYVLLEDGWRTVIHFRQLQPADTTR